jgi:prevent-host-death family protein
MARVITATELRSRLGRELDAVTGSDDALYVSKRGRVVGVLLDVDRYAELVERLEYLEDSAAAIHARSARADAVSWSRVRD